MTNDGSHEQLGDRTQLHELNPYDAARIAMLQNAAHAAGYFLLPDPDAVAMQLDDYKWYLGNVGVDFEDEANLVNSVSLSGYDPTEDDERQIGTFLNQLAHAMSERPPRNSIRIRPVGQVALTESMQALVPSQATPEEELARPQTETQQEQAPSNRPNFLQYLEKTVGSSTLVKLRAYAEMAHRVDFTAASNRQNFNPDRIDVLVEKSMGSGVEYNGYRFTEHDLLLIIAKKYENNIMGFPSSYEEDDYPESLQKRARPIEHLFAYLQCSSERGALTRMARDYATSIEALRYTLTGLALSLAKMVRQYESLTGQPAFQIMHPEDPSATDTPSPITPSPVLEPPPTVEKWGERGAGNGVLATNLETFPDVYDPDDDAWLAWSETFSQGLPVPVTTDAAPQIAPSIFSWEGLPFVDLQLPKLEVPQYDINRIGYRIGDEIIIRPSSFPAVGDIINNPWSEFLDTLDSNPTATDATFVARDSLLLQESPSASPGAETDHEWSEALPDMPALADTIREASQQMSSRSTPFMRVANRLRAHTGQEDRTESLAEHDKQIIRSLAFIEAAQRKIPQQPDFVKNIRHFMVETGIVSPASATEYIPDYEAAKQTLNDALFFIALEKRDEFSAGSSSDKQKSFLESLKRFALWANGVPDTLVVKHKNPAKAYVQTGRIYSNAVETLRYAQPQVRDALLALLQQRKK